ncbi:MULTISPECIES: hydantoinase/oxoprolinase family protein [Pseudomonas]|uniref:Hydantoinase/oxoprolinase family protein n=1 Tax=Pseudomonas juntendi TaxID=2666183 RepID=A0ABD4YIV2_9PSED|nr:MULTISPECIES: hydantoinase/oxoprolinase family protein [Pseudomonas]MDH0759190.1 hydantoinase/oxoprolinase family protein [Pseudomonas juntendi]MDH1575428.1 hydantoinase/oxoprolinase family protein [Pseudomonas sp. GD03746]MDH1919938.1 hydantoinase/oxoprolinase family protein [Pseudomonas juntendi]QUN68624.1 hydantoinase/oxoprolinase family protein [Pseudomonas sp. JS425]
MAIRIATDIGGTFTDLVYLQDGVVRAVKADTTPPNFEQGLLDAVEKSGVAYSDISFFAHGSTVVINTLTERKGVKTALITTQGFRDVLEIARGNTPDIFNPHYRKPPPFVPRELRLEVTERLNYQGDVVTPLDLEQLPAMLDYLRGAGVEAIAVSLLHAYRNPDHEQRLVTAIEELWPEVAVIASHQVSRGWREYERTNSCVLSAYVMPATRDYLDNLHQHLAAKGLRQAPFIMKSNGGIAPLAAVKGDPISLVESGPVGGILGAQAYGNLIGETELLALDIGGTTAKCSLIHDGRVEISNDYVIEKTPTSAGYPIMSPVVDIVEIGNGGGSIAWVDAAGSLRVGPQSAGSTPGPVAYGRGGMAPTTTDANLITGRINPQGFANGEIEPDLASVERAFARIGDQLGVSANILAHGVLQIANANMVNALKLISVNRGYDPRDFSLMAFGGGGALHATALAAELGIPKVIIPPFAGVFSAWGMLMLDVRRDYIQTHLQMLDQEGLAELESAFAALQSSAETEFASDGLSPESLRFEWQLDARYLGQEHTVKIALDSLELQAMLESFHERHQQNYTFRLEAPVEVVNLHLVAFAEVRKSPIAPIAPSADSCAEQARRGQRMVEFEPERPVSTPIYRREVLLAGMRFVGPAIIEEATTTTVVRPGDRVEVDAYGGLHINISTQEA